MVELFCDSFDTVPRRIVLDIDDTEDRAYGGQQLSLFNAHHDSRCFMPIHIYEAISAKPVAVFLRPGKTPDGTEVCLVLRHVVRAIRARWPRVDILIRGDSHGACPGEGRGRPEAMAWCERNRVGYIFGLAGNKVLLRRVTAEAEQAALDRLDAPTESKVRRYAEFRYAARTWTTERRVIARVEASAQGVDSRFIVTNLAGLAKSLYEKVYCARGQAENPAFAGAGSDQGSQAASRLGPHLLHQGNRQPVPPAAPHRRLLADAHPARTGAETIVLA